MFCDFMDSILTWCKIINIASILISDMTNSSIFEMNQILNSLVLKLNKKQFQT